MVKLRRDFSNASKQKLLKAVADVEKEKISNFTDWVGDSYYSFQSWIGKLNIKNYMSDVDSYHKKVIDKNNASKQAIENIFKNVGVVDTTYQKKFSSIKACLQKWDKYIVQMERIVNPGNSSFTSSYIENSLKTVDTSIIQNIDHTYPITSAGGINSLIEGVLRALSKNDIKSNVKIEESVLKNASSLLNAVGKKKKDKDASLIAALLSYLSSLCGVATKDTTQKTKAASSFLSLFKASGKMELGLYKYYEQKLNVFDTMRLDKKFGKTMTGISLLTKIASTADEGLDTYNTFTDSKSSAYDKSAQVLEMTGSVFDLGVNSYTTVMASKKYLRYVDSISGGSKKVVNQILVDTRELKYTTSSAVSKKIAKASTIVALADVGVSTVASGIRQWGKVSQDGTVSVEDVASVGMYGSLSGLNTVTSSLTLGVVHFDSDGVAKDLEKKASDFAKSDSWAAEAIRDQLRKGHWYNDAAAFGLSVGVGAAMVGEKAVDGVKKGAKTVGSWISTGWKYATAGFGKRDFVVREPIIW